MRRAIALVLGLSALIERHLTDPGTERNRQFPLANLLRQSGLLEAGQARLLTVGETVSLWVPEDACHVIN